MIALTTTIDLFSAIHRHSFHSNDCWHRKRCPYEYLRRIPYLNKFLNKCLHQHLTLVDTNTRVQQYNMLM
jgi:hypothetical protein